MMQLTADHHEKLIANLIGSGVGQLQAEAIAHALVDLQGSAEKIFNTLVPELLTPAADRKTEEVWWEIREEFRHIGYHMADVEDPVSP